LNIITLNISVVNKFLTKQVAAKPLLFLAAVALALRVVALIFVNDQFRAADTALYVTIASNILSGKGYSVNSHPTLIVTPVYPIFLATLFLLGGQNLLLVRIVQAVLGSVTALIVYRIARSLFSSKIALWAGFIFALHPWVIYWTGFILTETVFVFLFCCSALCFVKMMKAPSTRIAVGVGAFFGLTALCRPIGLLVFTALILVSPLLFPNLRRKWPFLAIAVVTLLLCLSPWIVRNYQVFGAFIPTSMEKGYNLYRGNNPAALLEYGEPESGHDFLPSLNGMTEAQIDTYLQTLAIQYIYHNPLRFVELSINRFYLYWSPIYPTYSLAHDIVNSILYLPLYFLALFALLKLYKGKQGLFWFFLAFLIVPTLVHSTTIVDLDQRFRLPLQPFLAILAAYGLASTRVRLRIHQRL
jgi:4-amino-4-deoxy-L-arabinose transferase-like glycosyltransferase